MHIRFRSAMLGDPADSSKELVHTERGDARLGGGVAGHSRAFAAPRTER